MKDPNRTLGSAIAVPVVFVLLAFAVSFIMPNLTSKMNSIVGVVNQVESDESLSERDDRVSIAGTAKEITEETQESLESVFVMYPDFLAQNRTIVLGQGVNVADYDRDTAVVVSALDKAYQDIKMRVVEDNKDSLSEERSDLLLDSTVSLSINHGVFSLEKGSSEE